MGKQENGDRRTGCAVCGRPIRGTDQIIRLPAGTWLHVRCWWASGLAAGKTGSERSSRRPAA